MNPLSQATPFGMALTVDQNEKAFTSMTARPRENVSRFSVANLPRKRAVSEFIAAESPYQSALMEGPM